MISKTILIGFVALAFVAGSIMTGTMASAEKGGVGDNLIVDALNNIATAISGIDPNVTVDPTPITINAPQGEKGDKGDTGDTGAKGDKGDTGDTGANGADANIVTYSKVISTTLLPGERTGQYYNCDGNDNSMSMGYAGVDKDTHVENVNNFDTRGYFAAKNYGTISDNFNVILTCFDMPDGLSATASDIGSKSRTSETSVPDPNDIQ